ncbi:hypothetical protein BDW74DRAFT_181166 [Aspergillus multicolor]|uniref:uncharacterized protein n=1 Tax=Aspergillus multicolor TaxID=41759 RepID=UPI003CCD817A
MPKFPAAAAGELHPDPVNETEAIAGSCSYRRWWRSYSDCGATILSDPEAQGFQSLGDAGILDCFEGDTTPSYIDVWNQPDCNGKTALLYFGQFYDSNISTSFVAASWKVPKDLLPVERMDLSASPALVIGNTRGPADARKDQPCDIFMVAYSSLSVDTDRKLLCATTRGLFTCVRVRQFKE